MSFNFPARTSDSGSNTANPVKKPGRTPNLVSPVGSSSSRHVKRHDCLGVTLLDDETLPRNAKGRTGIKKSSSEGNLSKPMEVTEVYDDTSAAKSHDRSVTRTFELRKQANLLKAKKLDDLVRSRMDPYFPEKPRRPRQCPSPNNSPARSPTRSQARKASLPIPSVTRKVSVTGEKSGPAEKPKRAQISQRPQSLKKTSASSSQAALTIPKPIGSMKKIPLTKSQILQPVVVKPRPANERVDGKAKSFRSYQNSPTSHMKSMPNLARNEAKRRSSYSDDSIDGSVAGIDLDLELGIHDDLDASPIDNTAGIRDHQVFVSSATSMPVLTLVNSTPYQGAASARSTQASSLVSPLNQRLCARCRNETDCLCDRPGSCNKCRANAVHDSPPSRLKPVMHDGFSQTAGAAADATSQTEQREQRNCDSQTDLSCLTDAKSNSKKRRSLVLKSRPVALNQLSGDASLLDDHVQALRSKQGCLAITSSDDFLPAKSNAEFDQYNLSGGKMQSLPLKFVANRPKIFSKNNEEDESNVEDEEEDREDDSDNSLTDVTLVDEKLASESLTCENNVDLVTEKQSQKFRDREYEKNKMCLKSDASQTDADNEMNSVTLNLQVRRYQPKATVRTYAYCYFGVGQANNDWYV